MKKALNWIIGLQLLALALAALPNQKVMAQDVTVSYQTFYDDLSPYGSWVSDPQYGNVWVPNESGDFRPYYSSGHWVMTEYGNTWVSDRPWGWACYHYGRWTYNPYYGWVWIPGYEWAPAWVSWRYGGGQCGWAPLGPGVSVGVSFNCPTDWWVFVGPQYLYHGDYGHYWGGPRYNTTYINQTTIINNTYVDNSTHVRYNYGPRATVIQAATHQPVQVMRVSRANQPGATAVRGNTVNIFRPVVNKATVRTARPANVITAPKPIGRPQPIGSNAARTPAFHAVAQKQAAQRPAPGNTGVVGPRNQARPNQPQPGNRPQPAMQGRTQPAQARPNNQPQARPQQMNRPTQQPARQQPQARPQQMNRPAPQPTHQQPMNRPQPQRAEPMNRPQPQRAEPMNRPQPQARPQMERPAPQPQRMAPAPHPEPMRGAPAPAPHAEPHQEGGRR